MLPVLALTLSLRRPAARPPGRRPAAPDQHDRTVALIKAEVTRNLIGDAMLQAHDLPPGWVPDADTGESLFSGTEFEPLFISEMRVRFCRPATREHLDQHVGILPRWATGYFAEALERETLRASLGRRGAQAELIDIPQLADQALAVRVPASPGGAALSVDAVFLRRGAFVMALASWHSDPRRLDAGRTAYLAILADRKWAGVAAALT